MLSNTGQPKTFDMRLEPAAIQGYGKAHFGMHVAEVVALLAEDYPDITVKLVIDEENNRQALNLVVPDFAPVEGVPTPGPATLNYVFDGASETLEAINLDWYADGDATPAQRQALLNAGTAYVATITGYQWPPMKATRGLVEENNTLVLFAGRDAQGHGVQVVLKGVPLDVLLPNGGSEHRAVTSGSAQLNIRLSSVPDKPAAVSLPKGSF